MTEDATLTEAPLKQGPLPEFMISNTMRTAAASVAASFHAYQYSCYDLPKACKEGKIPANLQAQRERKQAYHLALKFLSTATLKENPAYDVDKHTQLNAPDQEALNGLLETYLDNRLNQLIRDEAAANELITHQAEHHPVMQGPW